MSIVTNRMRDAADSNSKHDRCFGSVRFQFFSESWEPLISQTKLQNTKLLIESNEWGLIYVARSCAFDGIKWLRAQHARPSIKCKTAQPFINYVVTMQVASKCWTLYSLSSFYIYLMKSRTGRWLSLYIALHRLKLRQQIRLQSVS